eukprot:scaffold216992_cov19-Tisochrysis_lutea.AAC.2
MACSVRELPRSSGWRWRRQVVTACSTHACTCNLKLTQDAWAAKVTGMNWPGALLCSAQT